MSTRAERIEVEDGRVRGVALETLRGPLKGRRRVAAGVVVSNADLRATVDELVGEEHLGSDYAGKVRSLRPTFPCFLSHLGLRDVPDAVLERAQGYYWRHWDPDRVGRDGLICKIFVPTLYEPAMAPEGGQVVILQKVQELDYDGVGDWASHKQGVEDFATAHLERVIPGVRDHVAVQTSASALTAWRFTLNLEGAMLGWEMSPDQLGAGRPGVVTPVDGLFVTGHWVRPGGGITPVIVSACWVAEAVTGAALLHSAGALAMGRRRSPVAGATP
jgi:prolycopene isomerase